MTTYFKDIDNLDLMAIYFTLLYSFCQLFQGSVACASFCFSFRSSNDQQDSCCTIISPSCYLKRLTGPITINVNYSLELESVF